MPNEDTYCGEKYASLLVTARGKRPQDYSGVPTWSLIIGEYDEAKTVVDSIRGEVRVRWTMVQDLQRSAANLAKGGPELGEILNSLPALLDAYNTSYDELPWSTWTAPLTSDVALVNQAFDNARDGTCLMDTLDDAITLMGGKAPATPLPPPPPPPTSFWDDLLGASIAVGAFGLLGYGIYRGIKARGAKEAA